jgi:hypothetical protein
MERVTTTKVYYAKAYGNPDQRTMSFREGYGDGMYSVESYIEKEFRRVYPDFRGIVTIFEEILHSFLDNGYERLISIPRLRAIVHKTITIN